MRARIHRGSEEIGGSCIELEAAGQRLVLDIGLPLAAAPGEESPLPLIRGIAGRDSSLVGVVLSHAHPDHYGLVDRVGSDVPIYAGAATARLLREAAFFTPSGAEIRLAGELEDRRPLRIGPFTVTPFLVDHSAFDAYALLIEASGRRLFYSGDIRFHGRKAATVERLIRSPPDSVEVILLEGTQVGRARATQAALSERDVEEHARMVFSDAEGLVLCFFSPLNVDRLVSLFRAAKRSGRTFVYDLYAASVARATGRKTIPQPGWPEVRVYLTNNERRKVIAGQQFDRIAAVRSARIYANELTRERSRLAMLFRGSMAAELERAGCLEGARAIWSQWEGYLDEPAGRRTKAWLDARGIPLEVIHASGHATVADLQRLATAFAGTRLVPIHTAHPERFAEAFGRAEPHADGEWWDV
jgi:ribonuclease J